MNTALRIGLGIVAVVLLVLASLGIGWALWGRNLWAGWRPGTTEWNNVPVVPPCASTLPGTSSNPTTTWACESDPGEYGGFDVLTIEQAREAAEQYVDALGYPDLEIAEVMEFERNFYTIVEESGTGIGVMELLVDKWSGEVGPEMGPNMMWNAGYGMYSRGGMMGGAGGVNMLTPEEALEIAQRWLDVNRPGVMVEEHADPFYGYYTIHTLEDGEIAGMLSVHGSTGQVWYHTWHGAFVQMIE